MKRSFRFFFTLIIWTGIAYSLTYGLADRVISEHSGYVSFVMLSVLMVSVLGMMKNISTPFGSPMKVK